MASVDFKNGYKKGFAAGAASVNEGLPGWFGTFADMMTLLFAFFVLLAAISTVDPVKLQQLADGMGKSVGSKKDIENQAMSLADVKKAADKMVEEMGTNPETGEKPVEVTTGPKGVTIGISSDISFQSGSASLKQEIVEVLDKIVPTIENSYFDVAVEGHTDNDPLPKSFQSKYPSNWELSSARASKVVNYLIDIGVNSGKLQASGYADRWPASLSWYDVRSGKVTDSIIAENNISAFK